MKGKGFRRGYFRKRKFRVDFSRVVKPTPSSPQSTPQTAGGFLIFKVWREACFLKGLAGHGLGSPVRQAIEGF